MLNNWTNMGVITFPRDHRFRGLRIRDAQRMVPARATTKKNPQSEARGFFRAANGNKIYNEGQRDVSMMTREGSWRDMRLTVCDVSKALGSVS